MRKHLTAIIIFILATLFFTYPIIFKMNTAVYGPLYGSDSRGTIWQLWWARYAYAQKLNYYNHSTVAAPFGNDMSRTPEGFLWQVMTRWLPIATNEIFTFNFVLIMSFILSAIFMYLVTYFITQHRLSSIISGLIFSFCPYHFQRGWEHFSLAQIQWIALYFYAILKIYRSFNYKNIILFVISTTLVIHLEFNYTYVISILTFLFLIFVLLDDFIKNKTIKLKFTHAPVPPSGTVRGFALWRKPEKKGATAVKPWGSTLKLIFAGFLCLLVNIHLIWSILKSLFISPGASADTVDMGYRPFNYLFSQSARILSYLIPSRANPILGGLAKALEGSIFYGRGPIEQTLYLGWVPIILSLLAWKNRTKTQTTKEERISEYFYIKLLVFIAIGGLLFSMPPYVNLGIFKIYFPSFFMYKVLPMFRAYARFGILVMLSVSILAGIGLKRILQNINNSMKRKVLVVLTIGLIFFEFNNIPPFRVTDITNPPAVYKWLAEQKGDFIIVEYPLEKVSPGESYIELDHLFYQRFHKKKLVNGALPGTYAYKIKDKIKKITDSQTPSILKWLGTKYVIVFLDKYKTSENTEAMDIIGDVPDLSRLTGLKLTKRFGDVEVYEVIAEPLKPGI